MEFKYNDGGRSLAGHTDKVGDCVCRAICIATGKPYQEVYDFLSEGNSNQRRSTRQKKKKEKRADKGIHVNRKWMQDYIESLGFTWTPTMLVGQGCKVHLKKEELPNGILIVSVSKHWTTVIDGVINDTYNPDRGGTRCVYGYYTKNK